MTLARAYGPGKFGLSFELFPPKSDKAEAELFENLARLMMFRPDFVTCTYGAGGSTREKTLDVIARVRREYGCPVASHLTCVGSTRDQLRAYLREAGNRGVENLVALRGDPPKGQTTFQAVEGGLRYANELVEMVKAEFPQFGIAVAGYPETHQEAPSPEIDLQNLVRKVQAGADAVVTQLFYDNADFFRFRERYQAAGLTVPLVPGILPITNFAQIQRITSLCGAKLPAELAAAMAARADDAAGQFELGVEFALQQVQELVDAGVPGVHFYVLNKSPATARVLSELRWPAHLARPAASLS